LSRKAEEPGKISAAARCEELIGKHRGKFVDRNTFQLDDDPSHWTEAQLDAVGTRRRIAVLAVLIQDRSKQ